jgi:type IV pilus assembly protein PilY1
MHTRLNSSVRRFLARTTSSSVSLRRLAAPGVLLAVAASVPVHAAAPSSAPQVLLAITNSESMDGTTAGAIMVGSGLLGSNFSSLSASSSPTNYTIPSGFTPPLNVGSGDGTAPYTTTCGSNQCDNGPSRLNMTKASIKHVLSTYGSSLNFGLYTYSTSSSSVYTTWVYYMSPTGGFTFTNTPSTTTVSNPCYNYTASSGISATVKSNCTSIAGSLYGSSTLAGNKYMNIGATSDNAQINDVLYWNGSSSDFISYGTVTPSNPYTYYTISNYNSGGFKTSYGSVVPSSGISSTYATNAGYVPYSPQVFYSMRGWGYGGSQSATTGNAFVAMSTDPASSSFTNALAPETNSTSTSEIKSVAGQSGIYGLMNGAKTYLGGLTKAACQSQYVVMMTDGLPTLDHSGNAWPPLGTVTGNAYNLTITVGSDGSFTSSNSVAVTDAMNSIAALKAAGIKVFVIGLGAGVDPNVNPTAATVLKAMAMAGGTTDYFPATDPASLDAAFLKIVDIIYSESSVAAPVAPIAVSGGTSFEYEMTSIDQPGAGHVKAYPVSSSGTPSSSASWDAGALMNATNRATALYSTKSDNATVGLLSALDTGAFNLTVTTCVPTTATIVSYTIDPNTAAAAGCTTPYLGTRQSGWFMGPFDPQNTGLYVGPPHSGYLTQQYSTYAAYAKSLSSRSPLVVFTDEDGFVYAVDASSGALQWGWTSRNLVAKLQNYTTFQTSNAADGSFTIVEAMDGSGTWNSYMVGSFQSGAEHYVLKLDATGKPVTQVYDTVVSGGTSPGDKDGVAGSTPARQPPVVIYAGNSAYYVYVITVGTTSTLYETNIGTGVTTSAPIGYQVTSDLSITQNPNQLWFGTSTGGVYYLTMLTGTAATDVAKMTLIGNMVNPANGTSVGNVLYVGYAQADSAKYVYAISTSQLTIFGVGSSGWTPLWASTPSQGYTYNQSSSSWATSSTVTKWTASSVIADIPLVLDTSLLVPVFVAGTGCSTGQGWYDFFSLASGTFPTDMGLTQNGTAITADLNVGSGGAFTPSVTYTSNGLSLNPGAPGSTAPQPPIPITNSKLPQALTWRRR